MFDKVMVVIDVNSNDRIVLDKALQLARSDDFELVLLSCDYTQYLVEGYYFDAVVVETLREEYLSKRLTLLEEIAEPLRANGLNVVTDAVWSYPKYKGIVAEAKQHGVDLIMYGAERHGAISRMLLNHDDWQLVRCAPAPVLLVKSTPWKAKPTILSAVDPQHARHKPSGLDHKILTISNSLANLLSGDHFALHAFNPMPFSGEYPLDAKKEHQSAFKGLMADFDLPLENQKLVEEAPVLAIQEAAKQLDVDVISLGAVSRSLIADVFIGSTTEQVVDFVDCDILSLKPDEVRNEP